MAIERTVGARAQKTAFEHDTGRKFAFFGLALLARPLLALFDAAKLHQGCVRRSSGVNDDINRS